MPEYITKNEPVDKKPYIVYTDDKRIVYAGDPDADIPGGGGGGTISGRLVPIYISWTAPEIGSEPPAAISSTTIIALNNTIIASAVVGDDLTLSEGLQCGVAVFEGDNYDVTISKVSVGENNTVTSIEPIETETGTFADDDDTYVYCIVPYVEIERRQALIMSVVRSE